MSPIGRVFIVLNLFLATGFAVMAGQLLNKQANYKEQLATEQAAREADTKKFEQEKEVLRQELSSAQVAKTAFENQLAALRNANGKLQDDNKRLSALTSSQAADLKKAVALQEAANTQAKAAFEASQAAYQASIDAQKIRDEAVRSKDSAEAENRNLKNEIASLNETIGSKEQQIAALERDNSEKDLLIAAAKVRGFTEAMAAPTLAGTVTNASGRLCTISIADNPGNVDIQDQINRRPFRFAIYDENGYKAEAVATKYEPSANAILCNVQFTNGSAKIRTGDKASTKP
ncbi:MAG: hypothetical protein KAI24_02460 [Planctomycetes bacterium]|nr:hypothetical protein [Planctomycetota bacterium]